MEAAAEANIPVHVVCDAGVLPDFVNRYLQAILLILRDLVLCSSWLTFLSYINNKDIADRAYYCCVITGRTQIAAGSQTVLALGPAGEYLRIRALAAGAQHVRTFASDCMQECHLRCRAMCP
jgi:hypothetical protein